MERSDESRSREYVESVEMKEQLLSDKLQTVDSTAYLNGN